MALVRILFTIVGLCFFAFYFLRFSPVFTDTLVPGSTYLPYASPGTPAPCKEAYPVMCPGHNY